MSEKVTRAIGSAKLVLKKHSPEILLVSGIVVGAAGVFFACKGTLKAQKVMEKHRNIINDIHEAVEVAEPGEYTDKDRKEDLVHAYGKTAWELFKVYAPAATLLGASAACILTSHGIMRKRNLALATSLAGIRAAYDSYRSRVVRDLGEKMDEHFLYDTEVKEIEHEVVDDKGKTKTVTEQIEVPKCSSVYSRFFDESNPNWTREGSANYIFVRAQMVYLQHKLIADGHLFLNDAYKILDMPITVAGQTAGWIYDPDRPDATLIFFNGFGGLSHDESQLSDSVRALKNGYEKNVLIDFSNIQDDILTDLPRYDSQIEQI